jgi:branched-chain amino acid transport system permease protein
MAMFALAEVIRLIEDKWVTLTGGAIGVKSIPRPEPILLGPIAIEFTSKVSYFYLILVIALVSILIMYRMENSRLGLTFRAIVEADALAQSVGINLLRYKLIAVGVGCFFAGVVGSFYAHYNTYVGPNDFTLMGLTLWIVLYAIVGGVSSWVGPVIGTIVFVGANEALRAYREIVPAIYGGLVVLVMVFLPNGLIEIPRRIWMKLSRLRKQQRV